jgi:zinc transport system substrate-binding protein
MFRTVLALLLWMPFTLVAADMPRIIVSIKPVHSLVSNLLYGITEADLLLNGLQSPHNHQLKPSEAMRLHSADVIIWVGPALESFLPNYLRKLTNKTVITLASEEHTDAASHLHTDPHRWLNPLLAIKDSQKISQQLIARYPPLKNKIADNLEMLTQRLLALDHSLSSLFSSGTEISALLYHDAWGYFTQRYHLGIHGIINPQPHSQPGVRHLNEIQQTVLSKGTRCLLIEPQFKPRYLDSLVANPGTTIRIIDPLGANEPAGINAYFNMMQANADSFAQCR